MVLLTNGQEMVKSEMVEFFDSYKQALAKIEEQVEQYRNQLLAQWELGMTTHITKAVDAGIPKRQIGLAYGYKSPISGSNLVDKYYNRAVVSTGTTPATPAVENESDLPPELQTLGKIEIARDTAHGAPPDAYAVTFGEERYVWREGHGRWQFDAPPEAIEAALRDYVRANLS